jgi:sigma-E factor negative regulatory protein RseB
MSLRHLKPVLLLGCLLGLLATAGLAQAAESPLEWLQRMEDALSTRNYQGVFVHEHGGQSETLRILHRVRNGEVCERIVSMDGSGREFIRRGDELRTYLPDQKLVLVEKRPGLGLLLNELRVPDTTASGQYTTRDGGRARVAGRQARLIDVEPLDELRYGYRVWIDETTAMPLKSQLRAAGGRVVEQLIFTSLTLPAQMADAALQPAIDAQHYRWLRYDHPVREGSAPVMVQEVGELPPGFRLTVRALQRLPGTRGAVTHLVFSDGLASVSVFIDAHGRGQGAVSAIKSTSVGSSSAFSMMIDGYRITALGEVPPDTVRAIVHALRPVGGDESATEAGERGLPVRGNTQGGRHGGPR